MRDLSSILPAIIGLWDLEKDRSIYPTLDHGSRPVDYVSFLSIRIRTSSLYKPLCNPGETGTRIGYVSSVTGYAPAYYGFGTAIYAYTGAGSTFAG